MIYASWCFQCFFKFSPLPGEVIRFDYCNIFEMGWSHQLEIDYFEFRDIYGMIWYESIWFIFLQLTKTSPDFNSTCYIFLFLKRNPHSQPGKRKKRGFFFRVVPPPPTSRESPRCRGFVLALRPCGVCHAEGSRSSQRGEIVRVDGFSRHFPGCCPAWNLTFLAPEKWMIGRSVAFFLGQFRPIFQDLFAVKYLGECNCCQP